MPFRFVDLPLRRKMILAILAIVLFGGIVFGILGLRLEHQTIMSLAEAVLRCWTPPGPFYSFYLDNLLTAVTLTAKISSCVSPAPPSRTPNWISIWLGPRKRDVLIFYRSRPPTEDGSLSPIRPFRPADSGTGILFSPGSSRESGSPRRGFSPWIPSAGKAPGSENPRPGTSSSLSRRRPSAARKEGSSASWRADGGSTATTRSSTGSKPRFSIPKNAAAGTRASSRSTKATSGHRQPSKTPRGAG